MLTVPARLDPREVADLLAAAGATFRAEIAALPAALATWHPAPGEWCAHDVLGHISEAERRGFAGRIRLILAGNELRLAGWDQNEVARARHDCDRSRDDLLAEFDALREASIELVRGLRPADLDRGGHHEKVGYLRVNDLLMEWVHHDRNHIRQIHANVQAAVWPHLGNCQKFAGE